LEGGGEGRFFFLISCPEFIISCTSTYGVLLCVKFNKKNTLDGFEGLQGLWTGGGWDFRPDRFFFGKNQVKKLKKKNTPPLQ
jgi:hypothetical protein